MFTTRSLRIVSVLAAAMLVVVACADADEVEEAAGDTASEEPDDAEELDEEPDDEPADDDADADAGDEMAAGDGGTLTFYSAGPGGLANDLVEAFEAETGIEVEMFQSTTGDVLGRLEAEMNNPVADIVYLASWVPAVSYKADGRTQPYTPTNTDDHNEGWSDPDGHFWGRDGSALALTINTELAPSIPEDWEDLAAPEWEGLVTMPDPQQSGTARDFVAAFVDERGDEAWDLFDALADNGLSIEGSNRPAIDSVIAGANAAVIAGVDYMGYGAVEDGEPVDTILASSGTIVTPRPMFITEWAENVDEAQAFMDFVFSDQAQRIVVDRRLMPARTSIEVDDIMRSFDDVPLLDFTWETVSETGDDVLADFVSRYIR